MCCLGPDPRWTGEGNSLCKKRFISTRGKVSCTETWISCTYCRWAVTYKFYDLLYGPLWTFTDLTDTNMFSQHSMDFGHTKTLCIRKSHSLTQSQTSVKTSSKWLQPNLTLQASVGFHNCPFLTSTFSNAGEGTMLMLMLCPVCLIKRLQKHYNAAPIMLGALKAGTTPLRHLGVPKRWALHLRRVMKQMSPTQR